ncbi:MAG: transposase [Bacteroidales bacterium]|nr:transposase [Bacteroidales bacterium]
MREVFNAIDYQAKCGCSWADLPHYFSPEGTVRRWFHYFKRTSGLSSLKVHVE